MGEADKPRASSPVAPEVESCSQRTITETQLPVQVLPVQVLLNQIELGPVHAEEAGELGSLLDVTSSLLLFSLLCWLLRLTHFFSELVTNVRTSWFSSRRSMVPRYPSLLSEKRGEATSLRHSI